MFANSFQSGFISIFYSVGTTPLAIWDKQVKNGHIRRVIDEEVKSLVLEVSGTNVATTYITCPEKPRATLGIKLPFLVMIIKNMNKYFTFEIQILDDKDMHRRFRVSNFQSTTKVRPFCTTMPIGLSKGWNQVQFNLADFTKRAYGSTYLETQRVQIHANVRIRRIYFADQLYSEEDLPNEFKLFVPTAAQKRDSKQQEPKKEKSTSKQKLPTEETPGAVPTPAESTPRVGEEGEAGEGAPAVAEEAAAIPEEVPEAPTEDVEARIGEGGEIKPEGAEPGEEGAEPAVEAGEPVDEGDAEVKAESAEAVGGATEAPEGAEGAPTEADEVAGAEGGEVTGEGAEAAGDEASMPPPSEAGGDEPPSEITEPTTTGDITETDAGATTATTDEGETTDAPTESAAEDSPEE